MPVLTTYVIFSINNAYMPTNQKLDPVVYGVAKAMLAGRVADFRKYMDARAESPVVNILGSYKGVSEVSFICTEEDFVQHVRRSKFFDQQESILELHFFGEHDFLVGGNLPKPVGASLVYVSGEDDGKRVAGVFYEDALAVQQEAWSFRPDNEKYYLFKENNVTKS